MDVVKDYALHFLSISGAFAPFVFIFIHIIRPVLFLPVTMICITGGLLFGVVYGTIYSLIGITLSSLIFYRVTNMLPRWVEKLMKLKHKVIGKDFHLNRKQIAILRLIPFIHFHLLSLCLYEISTDFKDYSRSSFITNIPLALLYTSVGEWVLYMTSWQFLIVGILFVISLYTVRKKEIRIGLKDFLQARA